MRGNWLKKMAAQAKKAKYPKPRYVPHVHYIRDDSNGAYRVWSCWSWGDVFAMVPIAEFEAASPAIKRMSFFCEGLPEDDEGTLECPLCIHNETVNVNQV